MCELFYVFISSNLCVVYLLAKAWSTPEKEAVIRQLGHAADEKILPSSKKKLMTASMPLQQSLVSTVHSWRSVKNHVLRSRPRSRSSRTKRSTWLFCRSTRSTSLTSRRFYNSTRLGRFPIDWSTCGHFDHNFLLVLAHWQLTRKILCPST